MASRPSSERRQPSHAPAQHSLLALQRTMGNRAATHVLARMKIVLDPLREAREGEEGVVDTSTLSDDELAKLVDCAALEGKIDLYGRLLDELDAREEKPSYPAPREEREVGPGGMVTAKKIYGSAHPLHNLPGLIGPPKAFIATLDEDLAAYEIDPNSMVTKILLWRQANTSDHVELGALVSGVYTKLHLVMGGYQLIHGATCPITEKELAASQATASSPAASSPTASSPATSSPAASSPATSSPAIGSPRSPTVDAGSRPPDVYAGVEVIPLANVNARLFYATFLDVATRLGNFNMETNDCRMFADAMVRTLGSYAAKVEEKEKEGGKRSVSEEDFM